MKNQIKKRKADPTTLMLYAWLLNLSSNELAKIMQSKKDKNHKDLAKAETRYWAFRQAMGCMKRLYEIQEDLLY